MEKVMVKCPNCEYIFDLLSIPEAGMAYTKCPKCQNVVIQKIPPLL